MADLLLSSEIWNSCGIELHQENTAENVSDPVAEISTLLIHNLLYYYLSGREIKCSMATSFL